MEHYKRHLFFWKEFFAIMRPYLIKRFNYKYALCDAENPLLVVSNHVTDWDPFFIGMCFPQHLYFVASEHIFRWGYKSTLISWLVAPIARLKAVSATVSVREIIKRLKSGANVCLFAEGNRTWDGRTCDFLPSTGKLVRMSGATLVTFRIIGGYFTQPRWSKHSRKGMVEGAVVGIYPPDRLEKMTPEQINAIIANDISEDAYERQRKDNFSFRGEALAEKLETCLCICPVCGSVNTMTSRGDYFFCECGFTVRYGENGFFTGEKVPFDNVTDWNEWQEHKIFELTDSDGDGEIFSDDGVELFIVLSKNKIKKLGSGRLSLDRNNLTVGSRTFPLEHITGISLIGRGIVSLTAGGVSYELVSTRPTCFKKYLTSLSHLASSNQSLEHLVIT